MKKEEKQRLLNELGTLAEKAKDRASVKKGYERYYTLFSLHKQRVPMYKIAEATGFSAEMVVKLIRGSWHIPKPVIPLVKSLGFKICSCCSARIVPIEPIHNTTLTQLCTVCWLSNTRMNPLNGIIEKRKE